MAKYRDAGKIFENLSPLKTIFEPLKNGVLRAQFLSAVLNCGAQCGVKLLLCEVSVSRLRIGKAGALPHDMGLLGKAGALPHAGLTTLARCVWQ